MDAYVQTAIGVVVSIVLFVFSYRQTIGARHQRAILANAELCRAVLRQMLLENYQPTHSDLRRLAHGKARLHRIPFDLMQSPSEALTDIYATVFDNDLIQAKDRDALQNRIVTALDAMPEPPKRILVTRASRGPSFVVYAVTVGSVSILGAATTLLAFVVKEGAVNPEVIVPTLLAFVVSIAATASLVALRRVSERSEETPAQARQSEVIRLFDDVRRLLRRYKVSYESMTGDSPEESLDYLIRLTNKTIGIETLALSGDALADRVVRRVLPRFNKSGAEELWIVTTSQPSTAVQETVGGQNIHFMDFSAFSTKIKELSKQNTTPTASTN